MQEYKDMNLKGLTGSQLKWIALVTMTIDHIGSFLLEPAIVNSLVGNQFVGLNIVLRLIGRLSFPLFTFILVEGFIHTRNVDKYLRQLGIFALVSEISFDLAKEGVFLEFTYQNIFFTLFIGLLTITLFDQFKEESLRWLIPIIGMLLAEVLRTDYASFGILIIFVFYYLRADMELRNPVVGLLLLLQATAILALIPIQVYNGARGKQNKYFFYLFYPIHLLLLYLIRILLFK